MSDGARRVVGAIVGFAVGALIFGVIAGAVAFSVVKKGEQESRAAWHLVPVVVAARDLAPDTKVTLDDLSQRSVPEQMLTDSVVKPESAHHIADQTLTVPVRAGDPMQWAFFFTGVPPRAGIEGLEIAEGCAEAAGRSRRFAPLKEASDAEIRGRLAGSR